MLDNLILSWGNLSKRGMIGPNICLICGMADESICYLSLFNICLEEDGMVLKLSFGMVWEDVI